jgi:hypothetical protein
MGHAVDDSLSLGQRLLNLARHENISAVIQLAQRIETDAPDLGIRLECEGESLYLRYGDDRVEISRRGSRQRVRFVGEFGSEMETKPGRSVVVPIPMDVIRQIANYLDTKRSHDEPPDGDAA